MQISRPISRKPLPANARRVFQGVIFDVYQWEVDGYDGKKMIFEKVKRPDTVVVFPVTEDGKIVLIFEEQPGTRPALGTVGGRVDEGEDILDAAKRELLEETGYEASEWLLFDAVQPASKIEWAVYTFIARGCKKVAAQNLDGGEKIQLRVVDFDQFVELGCSEFAESEMRIKLLEARLDPEKMRQIREVMLGESDR